MNFEQITAALKERVRAANIAGDVVGQRVEGVSRNTWSLVDVAAAKAAAESALWYEVTPAFAATVVDGTAED